MKFLPSLIPEKYRYQTPKPKEDTFFYKVDEFLKDGHDSALENGFDKFMENIPWRKIGHFFADISVIATTGMIIYCCYRIMICNKENREKALGKLYFSYIALYITKCLEVILRE